MSPEHIQERVLQHPFQPFRMFLSDGSEYEVRQPEMIFVSQRQVVIGLPKSGERIARRVAYCDPLHITRIEPINGTSGESKPKTRRKS